MHLLSPLRNRAYLHLFTAQVVALAGTGLLTVALGLLAFDIAGGDAGRVLANVLTIKILIYVLLSPVITALAAQWRAKPVLVAADLVRAGVALTLPFIGTEWQLYLAIGVLQAASATFTPTFQATIPRIVTEEEQYTRALSLSRLAYDLEQIASPVLAAALLAVLSYTNLLLGTVVGFVASALLVVTLPSLLRIGDETEALVVVVGVVPDLGVGLRAAADDDALRAAVVEARGVDGVAAVEVAVLGGQQALVVAEVSAVLARVLVGAAGEDVVDDGFGLVGKRRDLAGVDAADEGGGLLGLLARVVGAEVETVECGDGREYHGAESGQDGVLLHAPILT
ncbi:Major Facilitator Superfamily protein [Corynebacterium pollutisoli]|uniref:Major Facilitator Superfamily protein n=1 Tax=Corynebacterium pollutisoli TaxID=1610489 RepID=A0A1X7I0K5_9CORY|nr:Major Facilitator Superfamily protein [Corynebacterium pollutisoli]